MAPRNTRNSQKAESKIPGLAQSSIPIPSSTKTSKLSLPESRKKKESIVKAAASPSSKELVNPVKLKFGATPANVKPTDASGKSQPNESLGASASLNQT